MSDNKPKLGLWILLGKFGGKLITLILKMVQGLKLAKVGLAGATLASYTALYSWKFAVMLLIAIGFHESGHVWAMKKMGIKTKGFYFLPFLGGVAIAEDNYKTYGQNAYISIMGPIWGALLAYVSGAVYLITGDPLWAAAAAWMATVNLFNLLPINPLDGGQLLRAISFSIGKRTGLWFLAISLVIATVAMVFLKMGLFVLILAIGAAELWSEFRKRNRMKKDEAIRKHVDLLMPGFSDTFEPTISYPKDMNKNQLALTCISYVGTIAVLILLLKLTNHIPGADLAHNFLE